MVLPSINATLSESAVKLTLETRSSAFNAKMPIPRLNEAGLIGLYHALYPTKLDGAKPKVYGECHRFKTLPTNRPYRRGYGEARWVRDCKNRTDTVRSSKLLARGDSIELRFHLQRHTLKAVTPTPAAYGRANPWSQGRRPETSSGLRVRVETPGPPVLGKERSHRKSAVFR